MFIEILNRLSMWHSFLIFVLLVAGKEGFWADL